MLLENPLVFVSSLEARSFWGAQEISHIRNLRRMLSGFSSPRSLHLSSPNIRVVPLELRICAGSTLSPLQTSYLLEDCISAVLQVANPAGANAHLGLSVGSWTSFQRVASLDRSLARHVARVNSVAQVVISSSMARQAAVRRTSARCSRTLGPAQVWWLLPTPCILVLKTLASHAIIVFDSRSYRFFCDKP